MHEQWPLRSCDHPNDQWPSSDDLSFSGLHIITAVPFSPSRYYDIARPTRSTGVSNVRSGRPTICTPPCRPLPLACDERASHAVDTHPKDQFRRSYTCVSILWYQNISCRSNVSIMTAVVMFYPLRNVLVSIVVRATGIMESSTRLSQSQWRALMDSLTIELRP